MKKLNDDIAFWHWARARQAKSGVSWSSYWATLISATVEDASPTDVVLTFSEGKPELVSTDITATVNGTARAVSSASWTGAVWTVVLSYAVEVGDVVVVNFKGIGTANVTNNSLLAKLVELDMSEPTLLKQYVFDLINSETRNNLLGNSEVLNSNTKGITFGTLTADQIVQNADDPDGGNDAWTVTANGANCALRFSLYPAVAGQTYTFSVWLRAAGNTNINLATYDNSSYAASAITVTTTWTQFTISKQVGTAANFEFWIGGASSFATGKVIEVWHPMANLGAEALTYNGTPNTDWFLGSGVAVDAYDPAFTANGISLVSNNKRLSKPNATNITGTDEFTLAMLLKVVSGSAGGTLFEFNYTGSERITINAANAGRLSYISPAAEGTQIPDSGELIYGDNYFIVQFVKNAVGQYLRIRKSPVLRAVAGTTGGMQSSVIGGVNIDTCDPDVAYFVAWNKATVSSAAVYNYINAHKPGLLAAQNTIILCDGDSNTAGGYGSSTIFTTYPGLLSVAYADKAEVLNVGVGGSVIDDLVTRQPTTVDPFYVGDYTNKIVTVMIGINHVGEDSATVYAKIRTLCLARQAVGWKVVICTFTPITVQGAYPVWQETYRQELNALIRANYTEFADALADVGADSRIGDFGDQEDTNYYSVDEVHLNDGGHAVVAEIIKAAIDSIVTV